MYGMTLPVIAPLGASYDFISLRMFPPCWLCHRQVRGDEAVCTCNNTCVLEGLAVTVSRGITGRERGEELTRR